MVDSEHARNRAEAAFKRKEDARAEGVKATEEYDVIGAPGFDPGRLQQSAAPVYKTEPHASADAAVNWSEWLDLNQRPLRSEQRASSRLRYTPRWRAVRDSNPSRSIDSRAASPDA